MSIQCFIFDWGGVLSETNAKWATRYVLEKYPNLDADKVLQVIRTRESYYDDKKTIDNMFQLLAEDLGIDEKIARESFNRSPLTSTFEFTEKLKAAGYGVYLLSNQNVFREQFIQTHYNLKQFDDIFFSNILEMKKPDEVIFQYMIDHISYQPSECLFVDDKQHNLDAAEKFGIRGVLYTNHEDFLEQLKTLGIDIGD